ncbi:MAG: DNA-processing protein DprA, partial [Nocardioides sp.]
RIGAATLVTGPQDVLEILGASGDHLLAEPRGPERRRDVLRSRHRQVLEAVPVHAPAPLASIAATAGISLLDTQKALSYLADRNFVDHGPTGWRLGQRGRDEVPD